MNHQINIGFDTAVEDEQAVAGLIRTCALRVSLPSCTYAPSHLLCAENQTTLPFVREAKERTRSSS